MHIEIRKGKGKQPFTWARVAANGKQTANNEQFPTASNAYRAATADVRAIAKVFSCHVRFVDRPLTPAQVKRGVTRVVVFCNDGLR